MTGLGVQQTNRRMCRHVLVTFILLCWPQHVYSMQVTCEAGEVTVGQTAIITCIFPDGTITPNNGAFVVKKFTIGSSGEKDILNCFHVDSSSADPVCIFQDQSLGYKFTFKPSNDKQTVVIPSANLSDAGEYGCDRVNIKFDRCNLTVKEVTTAAPVTTVNPTDDKGSDSDSGLGGGAIAGIAIGTFLGVALLGAGAYLVWRFKSNQKSSMATDKDTKSEQPAESHRLLASPKTNDTAKPADEKDEEKTATDGKDDPDLEKGGDRNSKDSTNNKNTSEPAKDGGP